MKSSIITNGPCTYTKTQDDLIQAVNLTPLVTILNFILIVLSDQNRQEDFIESPGKIHCALYLLPEKLITNHLLLGFITTCSTKRAAQSLLNW